MLQKKYPLLGSSANPDKLSTTFQGIALALVPLIIMIAKGFELQLAEGEVISFVNAIASSISAVAIVFGMGRKFYYKFKK